MPGPSLLVEAGGGLAILTVNRPEKMNALDDGVIDGLSRAFKGFRDDREVRAVILTGAGDRAFVGGADLSMLSRCDPASARERAVHGQGLTLLMEGLGKPVIAAINGYALGGGCELALACTLRIAAEGAKIGQPEVKLGIMAGFGGSQRLPRLVGRGRALELLLTGEAIDAAEALRIGLVNRVVKREALLDESRALAAKVMAAGPLAVRDTLEAVRLGMETTLEAGLSLEADLFARGFSSADAKEGIAAFLEKRAPRFKGE